MRYNFFLSLILSFCFVSVSAQNNNENNKFFSGFFNFNYQLKLDKIFLEVDKINQDFLYINSLTTGLGSNDIGLDRGQLGNERIVKFRKYGNKLLLVQPNQNFRAIQIMLLKLIVWSKLLQILLFLDLK